MITLLLANRFDTDPENIWFAASVELLVEAVLASVLVGVVFYG